MRMILQDNQTGKVIVFDVLNARLVDSESMAYQVSEIKTHCYNVKDYSMFKED